MRFFVAPIALSLFVLVLSSHTRAAEPDLFDSPLNGSAQHLEFEKVNARLKQQQGLTADFTQTKHLSVLTKPLLSSGHFIFAGERGVLWDQSSPFVQTLLITKGGITEYLEDGSEQRAPSAGAGAVTGFSKMFISLFSGDVALLEEQFELYFVGSDTSWEIGAKPRSEEVARFVTRIAVKGAKSPERVMVWETNGDSSEIDFKNIVVGSPVLDQRERKFFR